MCSRLQQANTQDHREDGELKEFSVASLAPPSPVIKYTFCHQQLVLQQDKNIKIVLK